MKKVLIVMGSDSDFHVVKNTLITLKKFDVSYTLKVCSAHRTPDDAAFLAKNAKSDGYGVIIAAAGLAAHLPGVMAAYTTLPVIGIPISGGALNGVDAMYAIVQMPSGIPVATVAIDGASNAAYLAIQILSLSDESLSQKLEDFKNELKVQVAKRNEKIASILVDEGL